MSVNVILEQSRVRATIKDYILTRQVASVNAAKERSESTKFFWRAETIRRNRVARANRFLLSRMARYSRCELEVFA
jgi:hypothetical protein